MLPVIRTAEDAREWLAQCETEARFRTPEMLPARVTVSPGQIESSSIQIKSGGHFLATGLNLAYTTGAGAEIPLVEFRDEFRGLPFMPSRVPIDLIATPGRRGATQAESGIRFGEKEFRHLFASNSTFSIQVELPAAAAAPVTVDIVLIGYRIKVFN